jgi:U3 small nucleolar RNA-associated protein 11
MSKKVFHSREHRERAQPANRTRLGLLEKKKDYVLRARDFQSKKKRLHSMKVKAAYKNPDEFYFGMIKSRIDKATGKVRKEAEHEKLPGDVVKLMKSQDLKHIQEMIRVNEAKLETFKQEHSITIGKMTVLAVDDSKTKTKSKGNHSKFIEDDEELADLLIENNEEDENEDESEDENEEKTAVDASSPSDLIVQEYQARIDRIKALKIAERKLLQERLAAAKGRKRKAGEDENGISIYKFDPERKK